MVSKGIRCMDPRDSKSGSSMLNPIIGYLDRFKSVSSLQTLVSYQLPTCGNIINVMILQNMVEITHILF